MYINNTSLLIVLWDGVKKANKPAQLLKGNQCLSLTKRRKESLRIKVACK